jgi:hypothetical protein
MRAVLSAVCRNKRMTGPTRKVLHALLDQPHHECCGLDLAKQAAIAHGTMYGILFASTTGAGSRAAWTTPPTPLARQLGLTAIGDELDTLSAATLRAYNEA